MIAVGEPIGRFVALANLEENSPLQKSIGQKINNLVDLIRVRVEDKPIEEVANGLLSSVYDLRFDLLSWFAHNDKDLVRYREQLAAHIAENLKLSVYSELAQTTSVVLLEQAKIVAPTLDTLPKTLNKVGERGQIEKLDYSAFDFFINHPSPQVKYLKNWIDASLQLEVGLILSDLVLTNQIKFSKERMNTELIDFLYNAITRFGAFSMVTGSWNPKSADNTKLVNSMKILAATIELDYHSPVSTSKDELFNLINN